MSAEVILFLGPCKDCGYLYAGRECPWCAAIQIGNVIVERALPGTVKAQLLYESYLTGYSTVYGLAVTCALEYDSEHPRGVYIFQVRRDTPK